MFRIPFCFFFLLYLSFSFHSPFFLFSTSLIHSFFAPLVLLHWVPLFVNDNKKHSYWCVAQLPLLPCHERHRSHLDDQNLVTSVELKTPNPQITILNYQMQLLKCFHFQLLWARSPNLITQTPIADWSPIIKLMERGKSLNAKSTKPNQQFYLSSIPKETY